ncbi:MAG: ABC transporter permease [Eubacteriales bacterium]|nr:ABC transporter permease [Eubacteriales bacterium]
MTFIFITVILILWELSGRLLNIPEYILPLPISITKALVGNFPLLLSHGKYTVLASLMGLLAAVFFALIISYFMDKFQPIKKMLYPLLVVSQTIPIVALAPIMMIWFGLGIAPKVFTVALVCFFPLSINITEGLANTSRDEIELLKVMGGTPVQIFKHIQLPSTLPYFFSGLKISATYSVMGAVIGEWLGGNKGLGVYMIRSMHTYNVSNLFAGIIAVVVLSIIFFKVIELISWVTMPWDRKGEEV